MTDELKALAGHLLVVGGRAVRMPPPGALAEVAPKKASRAREGETFFILVTPAAGTHAPAALYEEVAHLAADVYFGSGGGVTGSLREALLAINAHVLDESTAKAPQHVHVIAAALRGTELFAARTGQACAVLYQDEGLALFPADRADPLVANLPPLGMSTRPEIQLTRYAAAPDQMLLLGDDSLLDADEDDLYQVVSAADVAAAIEQLKTVAGSAVAASIIRLVARDAPDPDQLAVPVSPREPRTIPMRPSDRSPRHGSRPPIPRAVQPAPAVDAPSGSVIDPAAAPEASVPAETTATAETAAPLEVPASAEAHAAPRDAAGGPLPSAPDAAAATAPAAAADAVSPGAPPAPASAEAETAAAKPPGWLAGLRSRLRSAPEPSRGPGPITRARLRVIAFGRDALRFLLSALLSVINFLTRVLDQILPKSDEDGEQGIPTNVAVGVAILIPVVIVVVVIGLALAKVGQSEFEDYLERAQAAHEETLRLSGGRCEDETLRLNWIEVMRLAEQAAQFRPDDDMVQLIKADAQNYLDCYDGTERRPLTLLHTFPDSADLVGPIVHGGVDLYTLDRANGVIYHDTLSETGDSLTTRDNTPIIRQGQVINNYTIGELFDLEWLGSGGTVHDNVLIALDRNGVLVSYSPTFFASAQQIVIENRWRNPVAMAVFRTNFYVLDIGSNQIWRYVPPIGERRYSNAPEEYFNGDELPDLSHAVDLGISDEGSVFILFDDGTVHKYRRNTQSIPELQPFEYREKPPGALVSGRALFVDNDPASRQLYIVDAQNQTVYETFWAGTFQHGYRPRYQPEAFADLTGVYVDVDARNNIYVLSGDKLYQFRRNPQ